MPNKSNKPIPYEPPSGVYRLTVLPGNRHPSYATAVTLICPHAPPRRLLASRHPQKFPEGSLESTLRHPLTLTNGGNSTASFAWTTRGAFTVSPEKGAIGPRGKQDADIVWTPQPGCKPSESLVLKVRGGEK